MRALAQKFKSLVSNFLGKRGGGGASGMNIPNKSPLEISDVGPQSRLKEDPFQYGFLHYPAHLGATDEGHYMMFLIVQNNKTQIGNTRSGGQVATSAGGNLNLTKTQFNSRMDAIKKAGVTNNASGLMTLRGQSSGLGNKIGKSFNTIKNCVMLYTPPGIKTSYSTEWANAEQGLMGGFLKGILGGIDAIKGGNWGDALKGFEGQGKAVLKGMAGTVGGETIEQLRSGEALNPQAEMTFKSVPFREFEYEFTFAPNNKKELDDVHKILQLFKFHMLPEVTSRSEAIFNLPSQFEIRYMYKDKENTYIPKISRCVLTAMNVDYTPNEKFTTFKGDGEGASPNIIKMDLKFTELEIMTKDTVALGY